MIVYPEHPVDPLLFDAVRDWHAVGWPEPKQDADQQPVWELVSSSADDQQRLLTPQIIESGQDIEIRLNIRTDPLPPRERTTIAMLAGVVLILDDKAGLMWEARDPDGRTQNLLPPTDWEPDRWRELTLEARMRTDDEGMLRLFLDGQIDPAAELTKFPTWSLNNPRSWLAGVLNLRNDLATGLYTVAFNRLSIRLRDDL